MNKDVGNNDGDGDDSDGNYKSNVKSLHDP